MRQYEKRYDTIVSSLTCLTHFKHVDILVSKNQVLQILYHVRIAHTHA